MPLQTQECKRVKERASLLRDETMLRAYGRSSKMAVWRNPVVLLSILTAEKRTVARYEPGFVSAAAFQAAR